MVFSLEVILWKYFVEVTFSLTTYNWMLKKLGSHSLFALSAAVESTTVTA